MKANKYMAKDMEKLGDHLVQRKFTNFFLVSRKNHPNKNFLCHRSTRHYGSFGVQNLIRFL